jgi:tetratricopeptide (TPR) repeat protein
MTKIGRNAPCPCGSGKKYKQCCLPHDRAEALVTANESRTPPPMSVWDDDDNLDELSNSVVALLHAGKIDQAELAAKELLERYPEVVDGLERIAMVEEARGHSTLAADYYRKAAHFTRTQPGYAPETTEYYSEKIRRLESDPPTRSDPDR